MDKEKFLAWLKQLYSIKERLIFGLVACVLAFRVYQILSGGELAPPAPEFQSLEPMEIDIAKEPAPTVVKPEGVFEQWQPLYAKPDMFTPRERTVGSGGEGAEEERIRDFTLDSIQKSGDKLLAFIRGKGGRTYFVREGQTFESDFRVVKIDDGKKTVDVYDSETKKTFTLSVKKT